MHKPYKATVKINEYVAQFSFSTHDELELFVEVTRLAHPNAEIIQEESNTQQQKKIA